MELAEAMLNRHSVRSYKDDPIPEEIRMELLNEIWSCNKDGGLNIRLVVDEPQAFSGFLAHYGKFRGVRNYIAMIGPKCDGLEERTGYYGERLVLKAQLLGLNTCWVALTFRKSKTKDLVKVGERLVCVIALGYGTTQGVPHNSKPLEKLSSVSGRMPGWFRSGMEAAQLAPTAMNQQKFSFTLAGNDIVTAESTGGSYSQVDLGIVKYHFEVGAGKDRFRWG